MQAMESRVEKVCLYGGVTLEIRNLMEYSGQGKCRRVEYYSSDTMDQYREQLRTWATIRNWEVTGGCNTIFTVERI